MTQLYIQESHQQPTLLPFAGGQVAVFSTPAPNKTAPNQDAAGLIPAGGEEAVFVVADGCGGLPNAEDASRIAVQALRRSVESRSEPDMGLRTAILDGIERANLQVQELGTGAGTTLAIVEIAGAAVRAYHVGDTQVMLVGNRGKLKLLTRPHSPVAYAVEAGVLTEEEAIEHEDRHVVSNVIGTRDTHIEIGPTRQLAPRDTLLIASDGLFDNLNIEEITQIVRKGPLADVAAKLAESVRERMAGNGEREGKADDLTFLIFRKGAG